MGWQKCPSLSEAPYWYLSWQRGPRRCPPRSGGGASAGVRGDRRAHARADQQARCVMKHIRDIVVAPMLHFHTLYERGRTFVRRDIWLIDPSTISQTWAFVLGPLQVALIVLRGFFWEHQCLLRASALTYTTLLALVPMLAFMFAFLKGLGVQNMLEPWLIDKLSVGLEDTVRLIIDYVNNVKVGTLGVIGLGSLLFSTIVQLGTVERTLNEIWGVPEGRPLLRKVSDYVSVMIIAPVLLLLAITANAALRNQMLVASLLKQPYIEEALVLMLTYVAVWGVFTFSYAFIPNTRVRLVPALIGGVVAGTLWQLAQWAYIEFQVGAVKYHAIYGAFAQLPLLMIWLYISWVIVLLGAELSFACQNVAIYPLERFAPFTNFYVREWLASAIYFSLARAFTAGTRPWSAATFAQQYRVPIRLVREVLQSLQRDKLVVEDAAAPEHYVPGYDLAAITPWHILCALRHQGNALMEELVALGDVRAALLMEQVEAATRQVAGAQSVAQWLAEKEPVNEVS
jgi:membrane protein